ncbi:hypothetical protein AGMMS49949_05070 [Alphaproteobacteria bacterium]|nr:hypothetical protein AGMMS49949_05070 [Alphaproteobacteria bacterium]
MDFLTATGRDDGIADDQSRGLGLDFETRQEKNQEVTRLKNLMQQRLDCLIDHGILSDFGGEAITRTEQLALLQYVLLELDYLQQRAKSNKK